MPAAKRGMCCDPAGPDVRRPLEAIGVDYVQGLDTGSPLPLSRYLERPPGAAGPS